MKPSRAEPIYLDYLATTPVDPRVAHLVTRYMTSDFGNASSVDHVFGDRAAAAVATARAEVAALVECLPESVVFTSGATESINLALQGFVERMKSRTVRVVASPVEHSAVLDTCKRVVGAGRAQVSWLSVDSKGRHDLDQVEKLCSSLHISIPDVPNGAIIARVRDQLAIATGAACSSGIEGPSHVLRALGLPSSLQEGAIRVSVGKMTSEVQVKSAARLIHEAWTQCRGRMRVA